jgi:hypothetical protein
MNKTEAARALLAALEELKRSESEEVAEAVADALAALLPKPKK